MMVVIVVTVKLLGVAMTNKVVAIESSGGGDCDGEVD